MKQFRGKIFVVLVLVLGVLVGVFAGNKVEARAMRVDDGEMLRPTIEYTKPIVREGFEAQNVAEYSEVGDDAVETTGGLPAETTEAGEVTAERGVRYRVFGEGRVEVQPDRAEVNIKIEYTDLSKATAQDEVKNIYNDLVEALNGKGVGEVKVLNDYGMPCCGREMCFKANRFVSFEVDDLSSLGEVLADVGSEYVRVTGITYSASDYETHYAEAVKDAIQNATTKVQNIVGGEVKLVGVKEDCGCYPICLYREFGGVEMLENAQKPLVVTATIVADFET